MPREPTGEEEYFEIRLSDLETMDVDELTTFAQEMGVPLLGAGEDRDAILNRIVEAAYDYEEIPEE